MYGGRSPAEELDNLVLHEPWEMPPNCAPNHCAPGTSILIQSEEEQETEGRRRFSILGRRRNSRTSSVGSTPRGRRSFSEGLSGGKVASLFESNPFSFGSDPPKSAAEIRTAVSPMEAAEAEQLVKTRQCSLRFGDLPARPPELRRASSISIGVLSRKNMLAEQNGARNASPRGAPDSRSIINSTEAEPVYLGAAVKSGAKHIWRNVRSTVGGGGLGSPTSPSTSTSSPSPSRKSRQMPPGPTLGTDSPSENTSSSLSSSVPSTAPSEAFATSTLGKGLPPVTEEVASGAATPVSQGETGTLGLENLQVRLADVSTRGARDSDDFEDADPGLKGYSSSSPSSQRDLETGTSSSEAISKRPHASKQPQNPPHPTDRKTWTESEEMFRNGQEDWRSGAAPPAMRRRSASYAGSDAGSGRAEREGRGETRESAILGFQTRLGL